MKEIAYCDNKICIITCVNNESQYEEMIQNFLSIKIPDNMEIEFLGVRNAISIFSGYQQAMEESDAKYKVYVHQDVLIQDEDFFYKIIDIFKNNPEFVAECFKKYLPISNCKNVIFSIPDENSENYKAFLKVFNWRESTLYKLQP